MRKILKYSWFIGILAFPSCSSWLDVDPFDQVSEKQQYEKAEGFYNQLNGIYKVIASKDLYGKELTWGFLDVLAQYYDMTSYSNCKNTGYLEGAALKYEQEYVKPYFDSFWEKHYNVIANCNNLIQNVAVADSVLFPRREVERRCIEGEARALRAMLHFDLLRMYAPAPKVDVAGKYMPYVDVFPTHIPLNISTKEILENIQHDLSVAYALTADQDTLYKGAISDISKRLELQTGTLPRFLNYRGYRLNHYAIKALMARVALYEGDKETAINMASDVIKYRNWFKFTNKYYAEKKNNIKLYDDVLFALYNNNLTLYESEENTGDSWMTAWDYNALFATDGSKDLRRLQWGKDKDGSYVPLKYKKIEEIGDKGKICNIMIPMIRLSEMYYILAECYYEIDKAKAKEYLQVVRKARQCVSQLPEAKNQSEFNELITKEFRREHFGEGQLFFYYKRLGLDAIGGGDTKIRYGSKFVFPIPQSNDI